MILLTDQEKKALVKLDLILKNIAAEDPVKAAAEEMTKDVLADTVKREEGLISKLVEENIRLAHEQNTLQNRVYSLETDIKTLIKVLNQFRGHNQEFENLKQKHYIY